MTQSQIDLTNHIGFQVSLLKLATIPGPNGREQTAHLVQEAEQIEALVERLPHTRTV